MADSERSGGRSKRGFAVMDREKQRAIAAKGGRSQGKENNSGNFANNRQKAREAGRKGGQASHGGRSQGRREESDSDESEDE
jgi:general stress protein YciG